MVWVAKDWEEFLEIRGRRQELLRVFSVPGELFNTDTDTDEVGSEEE